MTTLSPLRTGRITASRVGAILGVNRYQTRDEVMREMVRDWFGAASEFDGNDATTWGTDHEDDARTEYERATGTLVLDAQDFITHPDHDFIGVSPDGLVGEDGMAEFKCPARARYTSLAQKPEYAAQVQLQLACTGRAWCDFVIWRTFEQADRLGVEPLIIDRAEASLSWLPTHLPTLAKFHREFLAVLADESLAEPYLADKEPGGMTAPSTSTEVVRNLSELTRELRDLTSAYATAEHDAALKRHAADMAESRAFLTADGAMELRKHTARVEADRPEGDALVAEALVRSLRAKIRAVETRIDVGRTFGATVRAELRTLGLNGEGA